MDGNGQVQWIKEFADGNKQDEIYSLYIYRTFELSSHDIIAIAYLDMGVNDDEKHTSVIMKLDAKGKLQWYKCYDTKLASNKDYTNTFEVKGLTEGLNGDLILCGITYSNFIGTRYQTIVRLDKDGNRIWDTNLLTYAYGLGSEGINVFMQNGQILECGAVYGDGTYFTSSINFFTFDYNTGNVLTRKFFYPNYADGYTRFTKSYAAFYTTCTRNSSNGHFIVSGNLFSGVINNSDTVDYFGIMDIDPSLTLSDAYTVSAAHTDLFPTLLIKYDEKGKALFSVHTYTNNGVESEDICLGAMQGKQLLKERKMSYNLVGTGTLPDFCYLDDGGYMFAQNHDTAISADHYLDFIEVKKLHNSDTSSDCVGRDTLFTVIRPLQITQPEDYRPLDSIANNQMFAVSYDIDPIDTLATQSSDPCRQRNNCDTLKIHGDSHICGSGQAYIYTAYKNKGCGSFVKWDIDTAAVSSITLASDSSVTVTYKNANWQGKVYASLSGGSCAVPAADSLPVSITSVMQNLDLGDDTVLCVNNVIQLHAGKGFASYEWQDGTKDSVYKVKKAGKYFVNTIDNCGNHLSDTVLVKPANYFFSAGSDTSKCNGDTVMLTATGGFINYKWSPYYNITDTTADKAAVYPDTDEDYIVSAEKFPGCFVSDTIHISVLKSPAIRLGNDTSLCTGESLQLNAGNGFAAYQWNTGANTQSISVSKEGNYTITATSTNGCSSYDTLTLLHVHSLPEFTLGSDTTLCEGHQLNYDFHLADALYNWNDGAQTSLHSISESGEYWLQVSQYGCAKRDTIEVAYQPSPVVKLGNDTTLCEGSSWLLHAANDNASYVWQDGSQGAEYLVQKAGIYFVTASIRSCQTADSVIIAYKPKPLFDLGNDIYLCKGSSVVLSPFINTPSQYLWQDGTTQPKYVINQAGTYTLIASNECGAMQDSVHAISQLCKLALPSAFSPNGDGVNDVFKVIHPFPVSSFYLIIYNRWGQKIFETNDIAQGWNGMINSMYQPTGVYIWTLSLVDNDSLSQTVHGTVTLIR